MQDAAKWSRFCHGKAPLPQEFLGRECKNKVHAVVVPFEPEGPTSQLSRVLRDDFIAHLSAGGTADTAVSELRQVYPKSLLDEVTYAQVLLTLASVAWETGRLPKRLRRDALQALDAMPPPPGMTRPRWEAASRVLGQRLRSPEPAEPPFKQIDRTAAWPIGATVEFATLLPDRPLFLVLDRHWVFGGFHALALGLDPAGAPARLLQRNSAAPPCVFIIPEHGDEYRRHRNLIVPRDVRDAGLRHMMNMHARLIPPKDVPSVYASLAY